MTKQEVFFDNGALCVFDDVGKYIKQYDRIHICPICKEQITVGEPVTLALNDYKLFPNRMLHTDCMQDDLMKLTLQLKRDWDNAQKYAHWFG